ncbi:MAG: hypothetical protein LBK50_02200 [Candidatus Nomurabacteria bacterium]|jgi:hypothetical protein|nr:hypothetical protein [Candidatus Nomurabacteria bacterium]
MNMNDRIVPPGLSNWCISAQGLDCYDRIKDLYDSDTEGAYRKILQLRLPTVMRIDCSPNEFVSRPDSFFEQIPSDTYWVAVNSDSNKSAPRERAYNLERSAALDFVNKLVCSGGGYNLMELKEDRRYDYSGTISVAPNSFDVYVEAVNGGLSDLMHGGRVDHIAIRDSFTGSFKYYTDDIEARRSIFNAVSRIPSPTPDGENVPARDRLYVRGQYEVMISQGRPFFTEYTDNRVVSEVFRDVGIVAVGDIATI